METTFTYNPATLTPEQAERINAARNSYEEKIAELIRQEDERMERYYNCEDDYSWGGICTKANYAARNRAKQELNETIESIVRGGYLIRTRKQNILRNLDGELVATGTHEGRYGRFFVIEIGDKEYVSCAKKVSTYEKKGYRPFVQSITEKVVTDGYWRDGSRRYKVLEVLDTTEELSTEIAY